MLARAVVFTTTAGQARKFTNGGDDDGDLDRPCVPGTTTYGTRIMRTLITVLALLFISAPVYGQRHLVGGSGSSHKGGHYESSSGGGIAGGADAAGVITVLILVAVVILVLVVLAFSGAFNPKTKSVVWRGGLPHCPKCGQQVSLRAARPICRACGHDLTAPVVVPNRVSPEPRTSARELLQEVHTIQTNAALAMMQIKADIKQYEWLRDRLKSKLLGPLNYEVYANRLVITRRNLYSIELFPVDDEMFMGWLVKTVPAVHYIVLDPKVIGKPTTYMLGPFDALATVIAKVDQAIITAKSSRARPLEAVNIQRHTSLCLTEHQWNKFLESREQTKHQRTLKLADQHAEAERLAEQERQAKISAQLRSEEEQKQRLQEEIATNRHQAYSSLKRIITEAHKTHNLMHKNSDDPGIGARIESSLDVLCAEIDTLFDKLSEQDKTHKTNLTAELSAEFDRHQVFNQLDITLKPQGDNTDLQSSFS
jgi:hypothetical protein